MKVAFATDDKITISKRTGRAKLFAVYTIEGGEVKDIEYIENNHEHHHDNDHTHGDEKGNNSHSGHGHKKVLFELASRDALFITRHLGKHFKDGVVELGIDYKMTKIETIEEALKSL